MIGSVLKQARDNTNSTQQEVANLIGVTKQTYLKWENNKTEPKASQIAKIAEALKITEGEICKGKLNKRYSLEDFIYQMAKHRISSELQILHIWECISDHETLFKNLGPNSIDEYHEQLDDERHIKREQELAHIQTHYNKSDVNK